MSFFTDCLSSAHRDWLGRDHRLDCSTSCIGVSAVSTECGILLVQSIHVSIACQGRFGRHPCLVVDEALDCFKVPLLESRDLILLRRRHGFV